MIPKSIIRKNVSYTLLRRSNESRIWHTKDVPEKTLPLRGRKTVIISSTLGVSVRVYFCTNWHIKSRVELMISINLKLLTHTVERLRSYGSISRLHGQGNCSWKERQNVVRPFLIISSLQDSSNSGWVAYFVSVVYPLSRHGYFPSAWSCPYRSTELSVCPPTNIRCRFLDVSSSGSNVFLSNRILTSMVVCN
jgi:hypothetical protein